MLVPTDLRRFAQVCEAIGNEVAADESGFVAIHRLVDRTGAKLLLRPLLVEGMIALLNGESPHESAQWLVLIDSDSYRITTSEIENESFGRPLNTRFRNTVAHELVHLLGFRANDFGVPAQDISNLKGRPAKKVKTVERDTKTLSPLLLWSEKAFVRFIASKTSPILVSDLEEISRTMGLSKSVLVSRLNLIPSADPLRLKQTPALRNVAVGVAEWTDKKVASLRKWPLFINFDRNIVPSFLLEVKEKDRISAAAFVPDQAFGMCGGWENVVTFESRAGVPEATEAHRMQIQLSMEWVDRSPGNTFLFVVNKIA